MGPTRASAGVNHPSGACTKAINMNSPKYLLALAALALASLFPALSKAADKRQQFVLVNENFNNIAQLRNWAIVNNSNPPGQSWFQGNPGIFAAPAGPPSSYIAANFLSAANGKGWIDNWLITPEVTLFGPSMLSLFVRGDQAPGLRDTLEIRFSAEGASTDTSNFSTIISTFGGLSQFPSTWQQLTANFDYAGTGRFAFRYVGDADASNYIGIDSVLISTVPEPGIYLMLLAGLASLALHSRRRIQ